MRLYLAEKFADFFDAVPTMLNSVKSVFWSLSTTNTTATIAHTTPTTPILSVTSTMTALGQSPSIRYTLLNPPNNIFTFELLIKALTCLLMSVIVACKEVYMGMTTERFNQCATLITVYHVINFSIEGGEYLIWVHIVPRLARLATAIVDEVERFQHQAKHFILTNVLQRGVWVKQLGDGDFACVLFEMNDKAQQLRVHLFVVLDGSYGTIKLTLPPWRAQALPSHPSSDLGAEMWGASVLRSVG